MKGQRVFVSGGAGVIGRELVPRLEAAGATILVGDLKPRPAQFGPAVRYIQGDLNRLSLAELGSFGPDIFIHLAATFERSSERIGFWGENFRHNILLSHHLMTLGRRCPSLKRVVFASSYLIYDKTLYQFEVKQESAFNLSEVHPISPRNLTGMAKLTHEVELQFLSSFDNYLFSTICVRIFRGYGRNSRDVISRWVRALIAGEPITVYRPEGMFDYIYAKDSAEGLLRLAATEQATGIVNLGTGRSRRVRDVIFALQKHFPHADVRYEDSDIPFEASQADTSRLHSLINWVPEYKLEQAISEIVQFESSSSVSKNTTALLPSGNILVTSASRKASLLRAMQNAAGRIEPGIKVIAGDIDPKAPTRHLVDDFWNMPRTTTKNLSKLLTGCANRDIRVILPTRDGELIFWAEQRATFAQHGIHVIVSQVSSIARCLDKLKFAKFGTVSKLPLIPAAENPEALNTTRYVVKERFGAGSQGIGLDLDFDAALAHAQTLQSPMFQPFVEGNEISIDAWIDANGVPTGVVLRRREFVVNGESQITTTFRNVEIEAKARHVFAMLNLNGPVVMQAIITQDCELAVIEVNARFGGASTTALAVGLDGLFWSCAQSFGVMNRSPEFQRSEGEVRQVRFPVDILLHDPDC